MTIQTRAATRAASATWWEADVPTHILLPPKLPRGERFRGWAVVSAAFGVLAVGYGTQFTYGLFVKVISEDEWIALIGA